MANPRRSERPEPSPAQKQLISASGRARAIGFVAIAIPVQLSLRQPRPLLRRARRSSRRSRKRPREPQLFRRRLASRRAISAIGDAGYAARQRRQARDVRDARPATTPPAPVVMPPAPGATPHPRAKPSRHRCRQRQQRPEATSTSRAAACASRAEAGIVTPSSPTTVDQGERGSSPPTTAVTRADQYTSDAPGVAVRRRPRHPATAGRCTAPARCHIHQANTARDGVGMEPPSAPASASAGLAQAPSTPAASSLPSRDPAQPCAHGRRPFAGHA